jgi:hypothetical protein
MYDHYIAQSGEKDSKAKSPILASWCLSAQNYFEAFKPGTLDVEEKNAPWKLLLAEEKGACLLSPCTAMKGAAGFSYVLTSPDLEALFKQLELDLEFMDPAKGKYDGKTVGKGFSHPGIPGKKGFRITASLKDELAAAKPGKGPVDVFPCLVGCVNGGGNYPTIDEIEIQERIDWLLKLRGVRQ